MIDRDSGNHRDIRLHQVDRIEAAAKPDFHDDQIRSGCGEQFDRRQRSELEIGQGLIAPRLIYAFESIDQAEIVDFFSIDANALVVTQQMRRGIGTHLSAGCACNRLDVSDYGALAIGACDRDQRTIETVTAAHAPEHTPNPFEAQIDAFWIQAFLPGKPFSE